MEHYDDTLPARKFDNFQFVDFNRVMRLNQVKPDVGFATAALMEIPGKRSNHRGRKDAAARLLVLLDDLIMVCVIVEQFKIIRKLKYLA